MSQESNFLRQFVLLLGLKKKKKKPPHCMKCAFCLLLIIFIEMWLEIMEVRNRAGALTLFHFQRDISNEAFPSFFSFAPNLDSGCISGLKSVKHAFSQPSLQPFCRLYLFSAYRFLFKFGCCYSPASLYISVW